MKRIFLFQKNSNLKHSKDEPNPVEGDPYIEYFPVINGQQAYVVAPSRPDDKEDTVLIIYSHGSNTNVTQNKDDQFMKDLKEYGMYFTQYNYIFAASNQHGVNWGNQESIDDTTNLIGWVSENYTIKSQIKMIGFSMGGLPTMNFTTQYPEKVSKIALLAPTVRISEWNKVRVEKVNDISIKIWHGTKDVNVPFSNSVKFINGMKSMGKEILFEQIEGKSHFDLDTEYMEEILEFFES